ncbi:MAG: hypothetical protein HY315_05505 [Acidobacteria bacterium]|nr:hypothetical protein [Acidobacteriota bacterium]
MTLSAIIFMTLAWSSILVPVVFCFSRIFRIESKRRTDTTHLSGAEQAQELISEGRPEDQHRREHAVGKAHIFELTFLILLLGLFAVFYYSCFMAMLDLVTNR